MECGSMGSPSRVVLVRCADYREQRVFEAVNRGLTLLGGADRYVKADERILLKPNLLAGTAPEKAVTTHPSVFGAVAKVLGALGATLSYGDSPGIGSPQGVARRAGLTAVAEELGVAAADFTKGRTVSFPEGRLIKQFTIAEGALDVDGIVSLPKLKTHALTRFTGAVKNQFGCIPGLLKGEFHARMSEMDRFAQMLVDLTRLLRPRLYIMDAVVAMEGNGPRGGRPRPVGALLFSEDPVALDAVACQLINMEPVSVPTTKWGADMGLGTYTDVDLVGDALEPMVAPDFLANRSTGSTTGAAMNHLLARTLRHLLAPRPVVDVTKCTRCGTCVRVCPVDPKAVEFRQGNDHPPTHEYSRCIRCYCCQELCPDDAIGVETPLFGRIIHG